METIQTAPETAARIESTLAGLLTLISPPVGLLYLGRPGLAVLGSLLMLGWGALLWLGPASPPGVAATLGLGLVGGTLTWLGLAVWAVLLARRHPWAPRRPWRRWYALLAVFVAEVMLSPCTWLGLPFQTYSMATGSMAPALLEGDRLVVESRDRPFAAAPVPGDVVVFPLPRDPSQTYTKRLVAVAGDEVQMRSGVLHVNRVPVRREPLPGWAPPPGLAGPGQPPVQAWSETLPNGRSHVILEQGDNGPLDNTRAYRVPPGHVFVLGDNRDSSLDSRVMNAVGFVPEGSILGRGVLLAWPPGRAGAAAP